MTIAELLEAKRNNAILTQPELAEKAGVGLRFICDMEQGNLTLRLDKGNQVLLMSSVK